MSGPLLRKNEFRLETVQAGRALWPARLSRAWSATARISGSAGSRSLAISICGERLVPHDAQMPPGAESIGVQGEGSAARPSSAARPA
jgi:hypothetical protein